MEYLIMKGRKRVLVGCLWIALASRLTVMATSGQCYDWKGNAVSDGDEFIPNDEDPCMKCKCHMGFMIMCQAVACHPPNNNCAKWEKTEGECCEYKCLDPPGLNPDLPGHDNNTIGNGQTVEDDSITNLGLRLVASTVTSFLVLALLLFMVHRLRQRRLLLAMRRFEAQARRQQLEESESDQYVPDTYLGMIECPPYDPPPPYSSPKPHPRILPGEAPPPYEEVDQNRNSNNNNNCINLITTQRADNNQIQLSQGVNGQGLQQDQSEGQGNQQGHGEGHPPSGRILLGRTENMDRDQRQMSCSVISSGRVRSDSSPHRSTNVESQDHESSQCETSGVVSPESGHHNSLGRVSNSTDSTESHNCSCDSEQTLLKKTVGNNKASSKTSQTLPPGFCLGQDRSKARKIKQHNSSSKMSQSCHGHLNPGADLSCSPANSSQSLPPEPTPGTNSPKCSSLPPKFSNVNEVQRTDSAQVVTSQCRSIEGAAGFYHPLAEEPSDSASSILPANPTTNPGMSQSCVILRDIKHNRDDQEELRKSLPPLDFSASVGYSVEHDSSSQGGSAEHASGNHSSSHEYLRNIRLSNLLNSPVTSFDSPVSPASPLAKPMQRSHSVTSDMSVFSVCSETGEKRSTKQGGRVLRNDSQYPDIPISAHAMRMAALAHQSDSQGQGQGHPHPDIDSHLMVDSATHDPLLNVRTTPCEDSSKQNSDRIVKSKLNTVTEGCIESAAVGLDSRPEIQALADHSACKDTPSPKGHRSKKKDKHKQNRHSTGSIVQCKPKKHTHTSGASIMPSAANGDKRADCSLTSSPSHGKKYTGEKQHGSPSNKLTASPSKTHGCKGDPSKKKTGKPVCDSYKQYGFIDDPSLWQSRNGVVELRLVNPEKPESPKVLRKSGTQTEKSVLGCDNKQQGASCKSDRKRHLTSADKSSFSPSPTRLKSSRPRSFAYSLGQGEGSPILGQEGSQSPKQSSPRRKSRNTARSKKRVSYPVTGPDSSPNAIRQIAEEEQQTARETPDQAEGTNQDSGQSSHPVGLITVRNGPLSSYV